MTPTDILVAVAATLSAFAAWRAHRASLHARRLEQTADRERRDREVRATVAANRLRSDDAAWARLQGALEQTQAALTRTQAELARLRAENEELRRMLTSRDAQVEHLQAELEGVQAQLMAIHADMPEQRDPGDRTRADD